MAPKTGRTAIQYGSGGYAYIYSIYGMHSCMNVVANRENVHEAVLIRALQPTSGLELMQQRRKRKSIRELCNGLGKLAQAMGITKAHYGIDLCGDELFIETIDGIKPIVSATRRINIEYAGETADYLWRFVFRDNKYISVPPQK